MRVKQTVTIDAGTPVVTTYLIDAQNFTGYAKPIAEFVDGVLSRVYAFGHQIISQADSAGNAQHFVLDGSGSTRLLVNAALTILETYHFDAWGEALGFDAAQALTTWLRSQDSQHDQSTGLEYHLARWRDGHRFLTLDPFFGNFNDPQSLHKYLYVHGDPVNGIDPTGLFSLMSGMVGMTIGAGLLLLTNTNIANAPGPNDRPMPQEDALMAALPAELMGGAAGRVVIRFVGKVAQEAIHVLPSWLNWRFAKSGVGTVVYEGIDETTKRHGGIRAWITKDMLDEGTPAARRIKPPGWVDGAPNRSRGHLFANMLGGTGDLPQNLVTIIQNPVNSPRMRDFEQLIYNAVDAGEIVEYVVTPIYRTGAVDEAPTAIRLFAIGDRGFRLEKLLLNQ